MITDFKALKGDCEHSAFEDIYKKTQTYECINCFSMAKELSICWKQDLAYWKEQYPTVDYRELLTEECAFISYDTGFKNYEYMAIIFPSKNTVIIFMEENSGLLEGYGAMTIDNFWCLLDTVPNHQKYFFK